MNQTEWVEHYTAMFHLYETYITISRSGVTEKNKNLLDENVYKFYDILQKIPVICATNYTTDRNLFRPERNHGMQRALNDLSYICMRHGYNNDFIKESKMTVALDL